MFRNSFQEILIRGLLLKGFFTLRRCCSLLRISSHFSWDRNTQLFALTLARVSQRQSVLFRGKRNGAGRAELTTCARAKVQPYCWDGTGGSAMEQLQKVLSDSPVRAPK